MNAMLESARPGTRENYFRRLERVIRYLYEHLDEDLVLDRLAAEACMSSFHFHRVYQAMTTETVAETLRRLRLHRAAGALALGKLSIAKIAREAGYGSVEAFHRAFQGQYGATPAGYRRQHAALPALPETFVAISTPFHLEERMSKVSIISLPSMQLSGFPHRGAYMEIGQAFDRLFAWAMAHQHLGPQTRSFGVYWDDPSIVPVAELRSDACLLLPPETPLDAEMRQIAVLGGRYAAFLHVGPYAELDACYQWLFGQWLPQSGEEIADQPCLEEYLNNPREVAPQYLETRILMPLKGK